MNKVREILRLKYDVKLSIRNIASSCNCGKSTVHDILGRAKAVGVTWPITITNKKLISLLYPPNENQTFSHEPDVNEMHLEMKKKHVTLMLLWEEYKTQYPDGLMYTQYCERYRVFKKLNKLSMKKDHKAGEEVEVDWAGTEMSYIDRFTGEVLTASIFVAVLPASCYPFVYAYPDKSIKNWIDAHVKAFKYFGGVPRIVIPDNTKTATIKFDSYDPTLNRTYSEMARHYNIAILPARILKPRDKGSVENHVKIVGQKIIAALRNDQFFSLSELNGAVQDELEKLVNRPFQKMELNREDLFKLTDKLHLQPLPQSQYEYSVWKDAKVQYNYHVEFDKFFYSVHYSHVGKYASLRVTDTTIEVFIEHERVAAHERNYHKFERYTTLREHMPEQHKAVSEWSEKRFVKWAYKTGPNTALYIENILKTKDFPQQSFKTCMSIMSLTKKYENEMFESACSDALEKKLFSYRYFSNLLKSADKKQKDALKKPAAKVVMHGNIRGSKISLGGDEVAH